LALPAISENLPANRKLQGDVDCLEQRRILDDQAVWLEDRLAQPDFLVVDAAE